MAMDRELGMDPHHKEQWAEGIGPRMLRLELECFAKYSHFGIHLNSVKPGNTEHKGCRKSFQN